MKTIAIVGLAAGLGWSVIGQWTGANQSVGAPAPVPAAGLIEWLDIKPGGCPNAFNRKSRGVLPVSLLGTRTFDVTEVDIDSLLLSAADGVGGSVAPHEGPPGPHTVIEDVATIFVGELCECHELDGDGFDDLSMKFKSQELVEVLELGDFDRGDFVELVLTGTLLDGTPFEASDCIKIVR